MTAVNLRRRTVLRAAALGVASALGASAFAAPAAAQEPAQAPSPSDLPDGTSTRKVLFFDLDGVRRDKLQQASTPFIDFLAAGGQLAHVLTHDPNVYGAATVSGPGHSNNLTGVWPDKHQVTDNLIEPNDLASYPDFLTRLESERPDLSTFAVGDWAPLINQIIAAPDVKVLHSGGNSNQTALQTIAWASEAVSEHNPDVGFVYFIHVDSIGHQFGGGSPEYLAAIEDVDGAIGAIVQAVASRPTFDQEDWLFLATTDHGFTATAFPGHGGNEPEVRQIWTLAAGGDIPVVPPGDGNGQLVDLAPTVYAHLGVDIDPAWGLDGTPIS